MIHSLSRVSLAIDLLWKDLSVVEREESSSKMRHKKYEVKKAFYKTR